MSINSQLLKSFSFVIITYVIMFLLPALATADSGAPGSAMLNPADPISIILESEPRLQAPIRTRVGATSQIYKIDFSEAMNKASVVKAIQSQSKDLQNPISVDLYWEFIWESPQLLKVRIIVPLANFLGYSNGEYRLNVNGSKTASNQIITDAPIFTAIPSNPSQLWRYAVDGSRRELLANIDEPFSLSKLEKDDRYYLATRFTQYCECDAYYESLYALYDIQEHQLIRYPVELQTNYKGMGDFVVDSRGFFYELPGNGVALPQSNTTQTIHIEGYVHGASLSKDGKHIFMAVGTAKQEKDLTILLYSLEDKATVVLAKSLHGWVPESEVSSRHLPIQFQDVGKLVYFRLIEREPYSELRYAYSWVDGQITTWKPPFEINDDDWTGFAASSDEVYQLYADGGLYRKNLKISTVNQQMEWVNGTHLLATVNFVQSNHKNEQYTSGITLINADDLSSTKLYNGLFYDSRVIGSSLDGRSIIVSASNSMVDARFPPIGFGQADDRLMAQITPQDKPSITFYINDLKSKIVSPSLIKPDNTLWIPLKEVLVAAGWKLTWSAKDQTITGVKAGYSERKFQFMLNKNKGVFNGKEQDLIYSPMLINGITYINAGILQKLSMKLDWDDTKRVLLINDSPEIVGITFADGSRYEGVVHGGIPAGLGRLFNRLGQLIYEGEFLAGKYHGQGQLYDESGKVIFKGQFTNGKRIIIK